MEVAAVTMRYEEFYPHMTYRPEPPATPTAEEGAMVAALLLAAGAVFGAAVASAWIRRTIRRHSEW